MITRRTIKPSPSKDTLLEVLSDHYKDTSYFIQKQVGLRDRLFIFIIIFVGLMMFQMYAPKESGETIGDFISKNLDLSKPLDTSFVGSIIWFSLFGLTLRYFQTCVLIERQYKYIHSLEIQLSDFYHNKAFTREGKSYLKNYPVFSNWAWALYTIVFPLLLVVLVATKIGNEVRFASTCTSTLVFNFIVFVCITISTVLYIIHIHKGK